MWSTTSKVRELAKFVLVSISSSGLAESEIAPRPFYQWMLSIQTFIRTLTPFPSVSSWKRGCLGLGWTSSFLVKFGWFVRPQGVGEWSKIQLVASQCSPGVLRSVLFNIFLNDLEEVKLQVTPNQAWVLICCRVGKLYRGIWTGLIDGLWTTEWSWARPSAGTCTWITTTPCRATDWEKSGWKSSQQRAPGCTDQ